MPDTAFSLSIAFVHALLQAVVEREILDDAGIADLLDRAGINPSLLQASGARITSGQFVALITGLRGQLGDEGFGYFSRRLPPGSFALVSRATLGAPSLQIALRRAAHTFRLLQDDVNPFVVEDGKRVGLVLAFHNDAVAARSFPHAMLLRGFWQLLAWLNDARLPPLRFDFAFAQPAYAAIYTTALPALLRFDEPQSAVWFDRAMLQGPVRRDEVAFREAMHHTIANFVAPRDDDRATSARVRAFLQRPESGWPDLETMARQLHLSVSTLQRHLAAEGTAYQTLKDQLRRDMAIALLNTTSMPIGTVAELLGFADGSAFQRAFKNWTGSSPGSYRQR